MENILKTIESKYPVDKITLNGDKIWVFLRMKYVSIYQEKLYKRDNVSELRDKNLFQKIALLKYVLYGFINWFNKREYIFLSTSSESINKFINEKFYDRLMDPIIEEIGKNKVLYIQKPQPIHHPIRCVHSKNIVSYHLILLLAYILEKITIKKCKIKNGNILQQIKDEYNLNINEQRIIKYHYSLYKVFNFLYSLIKPKAIFVICYYSNFAAIKAAKDLGIKVIEIQHGVIGNEHPAYNISADLDQTYFPDYLLTFGLKDIEHFKTSKFIDYEKVHPIGNFYIDYISNNIDFDEELKNTLKKYRFVVGVTLQWTYEDITIQYVKEAAVKDCSICYLLIPRHPIQRNYFELDLPSNVIIILDKQFYELMHYVDFHSTVNSTCSLEAPSLGVQNIMININNLSRMYYGDILKDEKITQYSDTPDEYTKIIKNFNKIDRKTVRYLNKDVIAPNYKKNIKKFLEILQNEE